MVNANVVLTIGGLRQISRDIRSKESFALEVDDLISISDGDFVGILGDTGCGKTTLLTILGLLRGSTLGSTLDTFQMSFTPGGELSDLVSDWRKNNSVKTTMLRRRHIGFALQDGELLANLSVQENIAFPLHLNGWGQRDIKNRVEELIVDFKLFRSIGSICQSSLANDRIENLSGGQKQRVALARAIAHKPKFVFVDEPTASLNRGMATQALEMLARLCYEGGNKDRSTIIMVTHDDGLARIFCNRLVEMGPSTNNDRSPEVSAAGKVIKTVDLRKVKHDG